MTVKHQFIANSVTILKQNAKEKYYLIIKPRKITDWNKTAIHNLNNDYRAICSFSEKMTISKYKRNHNWAQNLKTLKWQRT